MLEDDDRETLYRDYTATRLNELLTMQIRRYTDSDYKPAQYIELAHKDGAQRAPQETNEDTKAHIYKIFGVVPDNVETR